jgi:hypothetical protein
MKPFQTPYTMVHNYVIDHIMPDMSPNAWKVLCLCGHPPDHRLAGCDYRERKTGERCDHLFPIPEANRHRQPGDPEPGDEIVP